MATATGAGRAAADDPLVRERARTSARSTPPKSAQVVQPPAPRSGAPACRCRRCLVNLVMSLVVLPHVDADFLAGPNGAAPRSPAVGGVWSVIVALIAGHSGAVRSTAAAADLRETIDAGANARYCPLWSVASLVGFGAVVAALPAFAMVAEWVLTLGGGPLVSLAISVNILAALTGSASGGLTIALDSLGATYLALAAELGSRPAFCTVWQ